MKSKFFSRDEQFCNPVSSLPRVPKTIKALKSYGIPVKEKLFFCHPSMLIGKISEKYLLKVFNPLKGWLCCNDKVDSAVVHLVQIFLLILNVFILPYSGN